MTELAGKRLSTFAQWGSQMDETELEELLSDPRESFSSAVDALSDGDLFKSVFRVLSRRPDLVEQWQQWSFNKRWSPSPYLDGLEVGHYDKARVQVRRHTRTAEARADFVVAEVRWRREKRIVGS